MLKATTKLLRRDKRGVSNVIVVMLSLILVMIIVANVILWSYQMNQLDWERNRESIRLVEVNRITNSSWFTAQGEYTLEAGNRVNGSYEDTKAINDSTWETFQERLHLDLVQPTLALNGTFKIDAITYPLNYIQGCEIRLRSRANYSGDRLHLKAFNWSSMTYSDYDFNSTAGQAPSTDWSYYTIHVMDGWRSYVRDDGTINVKLQDEGLDTAQTVVQIDFLAVRALVNGSRFTLRNEGALTTHLVSIWIVNSTHIRYSANAFINSGEIVELDRMDICLPTDSFIARIVTERGNIMVFRSD